MAIPNRRLCNLVVRGFLWVQDRAEVTGIDTFQSRNDRGSIFWIALVETIQ